MAVRAGNEAIATAAAPLGGPVMVRDDYRCECGYAACGEVISLSWAEYESVRSSAVRFAVALDHENPEVDRVLTENVRFATVEKFYGETARIARFADPRR